MPPPAPTGMARVLSDLFEPPPVLTAGLVGVTVNEPGRLFHDAMACATVRKSPAEQALADLSHDMAACNGPSRAVRELLHAAACPNL
jgi:hypothetical protein